MNRDPNIRSNAFAMGCIDRINGWTLNRGAGSEYKNGWKATDEAIPVEPDAQVTVTITLINQEEGKLK